MNPLENTVALQEAQLKDTMADNVHLVDDVNGLAYRCNQLTCNNVNLQMTVDSLTSEQKFLQLRLKQCFDDY